MEFLRFLCFSFTEMLVLSHLVHSSCNFPAIFNFGDSNSDTGGLAAAIFGSYPYPDGRSFMMPAQRLCDGRLILDFMAEGLGLPDIHAYLDSIKANFSHGANFATAGSTISPQRNVLPLGAYSPFSLNIQYTQFTWLKSNSHFIKEKYKDRFFEKLLPRVEYYSQALYTFDIGQNDITAEIFSNKSLQQIKLFSIPNMISNFSQIVKLVYNNQGGRSFWIHNTGPIGCLPALLVRFQVKEFQKDSAGCAIQYNNLCKYFNKKLKDAIVRLRNDLPLAAITYVDIYKAKSTLIGQAKKYGFELPIVTCCGYGGEYNYSIGTVCGGTVIVNGTQLRIGPCDKPSIRVNWDGVHYTQAANKWIYNQIKEGKFSEPPISLGMACCKG